MATGQPGPIKLFEHSVEDNKFLHGITENGAHIRAQIKAHVGDMVTTTEHVFHLQPKEAVKAAPKAALASHVSATPKAG